MGALMAIGEVAKLWGVNPQSIRNWTRQGKLKTQRTLGGHRRYDREQIQKIRGIEEEKEKTTIIYSRVSSAEQKEDLKRQTEELEKYCAKEQITKTETIEDVGSGLNYKKKGLKKLIDKVVGGEIGRVIISYKDRLVRFGLEILSQIFDLCNVQLVVVNEQEKKCYEQELVEDVLAILTVFTSKIYGKRSHARRKVRNHG